MAVGFPFLEHLLTHLSDLDLGVFNGRQDFCQAATGSSHL